MQVLGGPMVTQEDEPWSGEALRGKAIAEIDRELWFPLRSTCRELEVDAEWARRCLLTAERWEQSPLRQITPNLTASKRKSVRAATHRCCPPATDRLGLPAP